MLGPLETAPGQGAVAVTPSDTTKLSFVARGLWIGGAGDVSALHPDGSEVTYVGVSGLLPVCVSRVNATGTTATSIIAVK